MANELEGTLGETSSSMSLRYSGSNIGNFQKVMRDISREMYQKRAKGEQKYTALAGAGAKPSEVSGSTFKSIMSSLEQMRGGDIAKEYAAAVQGYKETLDYRQKTIGSSKSSLTSAKANWEFAKAQYEFLKGKGLPIPQDILATLGMTDPNQSPNNMLSDQDKGWLQTIGSNLVNGSLPKEKYLDFREAYLKENKQGGGIGWSLTPEQADDPVFQSFDKKFAKYLSNEDRESLAIPADAIQQLDIPMEFTDFLKGRTFEQQEAFMNIPEDDKIDVMQLVNGEALISDLVATRGMSGTEERQRLLSYAKQVDPTFSENMNKARFNFIKRWTDPSGKLSMNRNAINTALGHLAETKQMTNDLTPSDWQWINKTKNWWSVETGSPAITNLKFGFNALSTEVATVYKGGAPDQELIQEMRQVMSTALSQRQFQGILDTSTRYLSSKITSTRREYYTAMGREYDQSIIDPDKKQELLNAGIDPDAIAKENVGGDSNTHVSIGDVQYPVGTVIVNEQGIRGVINADGTITIL